MTKWPSWWDHKGLPRWHKALTVYVHLFPYMIDFSFSETEPAGWPKLPIQLGLDSILPPNFFHCITIYQSHKNYLRLCSSVLPGFDVRLQFSQSESSTPLPLWNLIVETLWRTAWHWIPPVSPGSFCLKSLPFIPPLPLHSKYLMSKIKELFFFILFVQL